jgi:hypothetical protein
MIKTTNKMIKTIFFMMIISMQLVAQTGMYAGAHKHWVNKEIELHKQEVFFKGYTYNGGALLSDDDEIEYHMGCTRSKRYEKKHEHSNHHLPKK